MFKSFEFFLNIKFCLIRRNIEKRGNKMIKLYSSFLNLIGVCLYVLVFNVNCERWVILS